ncbi:hypothetical protein [Devosia marina]|uniref:Uncharacterized protein n=1 Tax=Devosia marina TaxID=2683198 RepID=A0A7X3K464_9HYPH|nr:hypothetical protein [Devosia marina]MVT00268.1 hypothetical protein [Devosia marina]
MPVWLLSDDPDIVVFQPGINNVSVGTEHVSGAALRMLDVIRLEFAMLAPGATVLAAEIAPYAQDRLLLI